MRRRLISMAAAVTLMAGVCLGTSALLVPAATAAPLPMTTCALPSSGTSFGQASPSQEDLNPVALRNAIAFAELHLRASVQIFRNNCKVGQGLLDPVTNSIPYEIFSSTKSVISILTGIAYDQHKLALNDPIGKYLPTGPGWGDAAHRAITIRDLLTETAGLRESILAEFASVGTDPNVAQEALAQPLVHTPGTTFDYTQRVPDLLGYVVQRAVGQDLQAFAQTYLFGPIGIPANSFIWLRDRSGITYGYANLFIPPIQFAKLGLLMQNGGNWNGRQILSTNYISQLRQPTSTNGCYGFLFWVNGGPTCTSANIPATQVVDKELIPAAPSDLYAMVGALQQNNFMIPSLHMTVTWTGAFGDTTPNLAGLLSASGAASNLYDTFFRILMSGVQDQHVPDPGPYTAPPEDLDLNLNNFISPAVLLTDLVTNPHCNVLFCDGTIPTQGLAANGRAVVAYLRGLLGQP
ncbi:MAG TPA: serine hydrolase [Acidimicrobiales bacterium]|jgi:CubicO group peptidase (beta-lactamase class C family)|nr:serine hydrolase [Acidimicrobiales bacterium]